MSEANFMKKKDNLTFTKKEACGCEWTYRYLDETRGSYTGFRSTTCKDCADRETKERVRQARIDREREEYKFNNTEDLNCNKCGALIGFVFDEDLNGSRFYCKNCKGFTD